MNYAKGIALALALTVSFPSLASQYYQIEAQHSHMCLTFDYSDVFEDNFAFQGPCDGSDSTQWLLIEAKDEKMQIVNKATKECLHIPRRLGYLDPFGLFDGLRIDVATPKQCDNTSNHLWYVGDQKKDYDQLIDIDGPIRIHSAMNGYCLNVWTRNPWNDAVVGIFPCTHEKNALWKITPVGLKN